MAPQLHGSTSPQFEAERRGSCFHNRSFRVYSFPSCIDKRKEPKEASFRPRAPTRSPSPHQRSNEVHELYHSRLTGMHVFLQTRMASDLITRISRSGSERKCGGGVQIRRREQG